MKFQDWPERLHRFIATRHSTPFTWGQNDCCIFAADVVLELTGVDHAVSLRGTYTSALEASKVLKDLRGVRGIATAALGDEINPRLAQRGDIVMIHTEAHGDTMAVCIGDTCAAPGVESLQHLPMSQAVTAWRTE